MSALKLARIENEMDAADQHDWQERWHAHRCTDCGEWFNCSGTLCADSEYAVCAGCAGEREAELQREAT